MKMPRISALNQQWLNSPQYAQAQQQALMQQQLAQQAALYQGTTSASATGPSMWFTNSNSITTGTSTTVRVIGTQSGGMIAPQGGVGYPPLAVFDDPHLPPVYKIEDGRPISLRLPDGTIIDVARDGSFTINDKDAKVTYRANRVRDFNPFINASDKLEEFIKFCGALGVKQDEMLNLPVSLFIKWLIVMAAVADGEEADEAELLSSVKRRAPRCTCGRYLARERVRKKVFFCRPVCMERRLAA